jgi:hypothetical protein
VPFVNKKSLCFGDSKHIFKFEILNGFPEKYGFKHHGEFTILLCYRAVFLTLPIIFYFKTSFSKNGLFVNKKAYVLAILSIFLNLKSNKYFPRKTSSNLTHNTILLCYHAIFLKTLHIIFGFKTLFFFFLKCL